MRHLLCSLPLGMNVELHKVVEQLPAKTSPALLAPDGTLLLAHLAPVGRTKPGSSRGSRKCSATTRTSLNER